MSTSTNHCSLTHLADLADDEHGILNLDQLVNPDKETHLW